MAEIPLVTIKTTGGPVSYRVLGNADTPWLVVCHGLGGDHREFMALAERLASRWRVLLWDMPGHGASQPPPRRFSVDGMTDALTEVMAIANVHRPVLLGFSFGGVVAQNLLRRNSALARAFIAYACFAPYLQPPLISRWMVPAAVFLGSGGRSWKDIKSDFAQRCALNSDVQVVIANRLEPLGKVGFLRMTRALLNAFVRDDAFAINCPIIIIRGDQDSNSAALLIAEAALLEQRPEATIVLLPNAGHAAHLDTPEAFENTVVNILTALV